MSFESPTEKIFQQLNISEVTKEYTYKEKGKDYIRFKKDLGSMFEIRVKQLKQK